jgi:protease-4
MKRKRILIGLGVIAALLILFFTVLFFIGRYFGGKTGRFASGDKIAIVEVKGVITESSGVIEELQQYLGDEGVKAIILRVDSPGGGVGPSQEIYREIMRIRSNSKQKVVTSMGSVAASGGYYIASASDLIVANPDPINIICSISLIHFISFLRLSLLTINIRNTYLSPISTLPYHNR